VALNKHNIRKLISVESKCDSEESEMIEGKGTTGKREEKTFIQAVGDLRTRKYDANSYEMPREWAGGELVVTLDRSLRKSLVVHLIGADKKLEIDIKIENNVLHLLISYIFLIFGDF